MDVIVWVCQRQGVAVVEFHQSNTVTLAHPHNNILQIAATVSNSQGQLDSLMMAQGRSRNM
jgi:hypothetical protein